MSTYKLDIAFSKEQLKTLYVTNSKIIVSKSNGNGSNVAWQVFDPLQANTLTWKEEYGIYVSTAEVENGANLVKSSSIDIGAVMNQLYTLNPDGNITGPVQGPGTCDSSFSLLNEYNNAAKHMTVGLYQGAVVNGHEVRDNAVSAAPVLLKSTALMTPYTTINIWIHSEVQSNSVVTNVASPMTPLLYGGGTYNRSVRYDSESGLFVNGA